jgi:hypothetical protein
MADITNPEAIRFCDEQVRPLAEKMRALKAEADATMVDWYGGINAEIPNDASAIDDGRESEGVSRMTGINVNSFMAQVAGYQTQLNAGGVADVISMPCVRTLEVS